MQVVELEEIRRIVGNSLVSACTDVYAEVRALREILSDYAADTDVLVKKRSSMPRSLGSQPDGLVQLELKSLVTQLRQNAVAAGAPEDALLPVSSSPQRKILETVLHADEGGVDSRPSDRPDTAESGRVSLREMRLAGSSRPSTASGPSRPGTSSAGSRPVTAAGLGGSAPLAAGALRPGKLGGGGSGAGVVAGGNSRPGSRAGGRPSSARPSSAASHSSSGSVPEGGEAAGGRSEGRRSARGKSGGLVVSRLRAAPEEERQVLLAQVEGLRLSIDDEHDYRGKVEEPLPSLTSLLELKRSLQDVLAKQDSMVALTAPLPSSARDRTALSAAKPLPELRSSAAEH